jgi:hypothetical protein
MAQRGRKLKLTEEVEKKLHDALDMGLSYKHAAQYAGIGESTFWRYMAEKKEFQESIHARESRAALMLMALIQKAAQDDWRAAAWKLEHRWPDDYAKNRIEVEHSGAIKMHLALEQLQSALDEVFGQDTAAKRAFTAKMAAREAARVAGVN